MKMWKLIEGKTVEETDIAKWTRWKDVNIQTCCIAWTEFGEVEISTVFVGIGDRPFETMIFNGQYDRTRDLYATLDEAKAGHEAWVRKVELSAV